MRWVFGLLGLLAVAAIVGLLGKRQWQAVQPSAGDAASGAQSLPAQTPQRQAADEVAKALDAGMQRNRDAEGGR